MSVKKRVGEETGMGRTTDGINREEMEERMAAFHAKCHEAGLRITPQRTAIYKALVETTEHPSAEMVFRQVRQVFPSISLDTVNRTLLTLSEIGTAFVVEGTGDAKRFDANLDSHQHFKCVRCKRIIDFHDEPYDQIPMPKNLPATFDVLRTTVYVEGVCDLCRQKNN
jgi:Fur family transcriptional regulator, peroxide stress response regulator